ncbi:uncharacterized protein LOC103523915 [Nephila pilipes]|uniref:Uncharacterized protein LOC103523915 n=1 Tax=Nephila pilipes TaxID=299642 RepID=A0A8X6TRF0_NEPPI|nr:uncharacterized protein LOC103523915 [Nephila pilipes]
MEYIAAPLYSLKRCISEKIMLNYNMDLTNKSRVKSWENIGNDWKEFSHRPRKEAVANFRLKTGHDCLAEHLKRTGILTNSSCLICKIDTMNREHLLVCLGHDSITSMDLQESHVLEGEHVLKAPPQELFRGFYRCLNF